MKSKQQLSALDISVLAGELRNALIGSRIQQIQAVGKRSIKIKTHSKGTSSDIVIAPAYLCISRYSRKAEKEPSPFVMQLRKKIGNSTIRDVRQHGTDRIIEFLITKSDGEELNLIIELFSKGNLILCDESGKIIGLLEWQKWRDRKLGVGNIYEHPPATQDPFGLTPESFKDIISKSGKSVIATLATSMNLGGSFAEEICGKSGILKSRDAGSLSEEEKDALFESLRLLLEKIRAGADRPAIILDAKGEAFDVSPFDMGIHKGSDKKYAATFNDAIDEYFSNIDAKSMEARFDEKLGEKLLKLELMRDKQESYLAELGEKSALKKAAGDAIYQNLSDMDEVLSLARKAKSKEELRGAKIRGVKIKDINDASVTVETDEA